MSDERFHYKPIKLTGKDARDIIDELNGKVVPEKEKERMEFLNECRQLKKNVSIGKSTMKMDKKTIEVNTLIRIIEMFITDIQNDSFEKIPESELERIKGIADIETLEFLISRIRKINTVNELKLVFGLQGDKNG